MLFTLEPLPAAEGDCLLLHWGTAANPKIALIDGGPGRIYENHLRPRLEEIVANLDVPRLPLELVMISHMDSDHIVGVKKLLRDIKSEISDAVPASDRLFAVKRLWLNVFNDILGDPIDKYYTTLTASYTASVGGSPNPAIVAKLAEAFEARQGEGRDEALHDAWDVSLVLAGHGEGRHVRDDHKFIFEQHQTAALNSPFQNAAGQPTLITAEMTPAPVDIAGLKFKIVGPLKAEIIALQKEFDDYIVENGLTVEAVLAAYADKSAKNLSSIVCLTTFGGKSILFTGDARGDKILNGLANANLLDGNGALSVDVLKVPHHGSDRNVVQEFFEKITADTYVFSGDGKHGNPDRDTLEWLANARGKDAKYRILLTYGINHIDTERKADFAKKNKAWTDQTDSLADFFATAAADGYKFTVTDGAPAMIDLGDEVVGW